LLIFFEFELKTKERCNLFVICNRNGLGWFCCEAAGKQLNNTPGVGLVGPAAPLKKAGVSWLGELL